MVISEEAALSFERDSYASLQDTCFIPFSQELPHLPVFLVEMSLVSSLFGPCSRATLAPRTRFSNS